MRSMRRIFGPALLTAGVIALGLTTVRGQAPQQRTSDDALRARGGERNHNSGITAEQMERLEARIAIATAIVNRFQRDAKARGLARGWRQSTLETLLPLSLEGLRRVEQQAFNLDTVASVARGVDDDPDALGDFDKDLTYTPIPPCRFIDTRNVGGKIAGVRGFDADTGGSNYGGAAACIPVQLFGVTSGLGADQIAALAMNVTLVDTSSAAPPGFVAVKPTAASPTTSLLNWHEQGSSVQVANQGIVTLQRAAPIADEFVIQTSGPVHIIADIFGAFIAPQATALQIQIEQTGWLVDSGSPLFDVVANCPAGYSITGGGFNHNAGAAGQLIVNDSARFQNGWHCRGVWTGGGTQSGYCEAICGRVPGR